MMNYLTYYICIILIINAKNVHSKSCIIYQQCSQCISQVKCSWCLDEAYNNQLNGKYLSRCNNLEYHLINGCKNIYNPISSMNYFENNEIKSETRIQPQKIQLSLRENEIIEFNITIKTPKDFPIDLYFLMDSSFSMSDDKITISNLAENLVVKMNKITPNFRLGFGGFVDKPLSPYSDQNTDHSSVGSNSAIFNFINVLPLQNDYKSFKEHVEEFNMYYNNDKPEGTLDALLQTILCEKHIGWKPKGSARRLVVITTDSPFHIAGDGAMAGLFDSPDGSCHLNDESNIDQSIKFDYPSPGQLKFYLLENEVVPIFAVTEGDIEGYRELVKFFGVETASVVDVLNEGSTNIDELLEAAVSKITETVNVRIDEYPGIQASIKAYCNGTMNNFGYCENISAEQMVIFSIELKITDCNNLPPNKTIKVITTFGSVDVFINDLCKCPCEDKPISLAIQTKNKCSNNGILKCGMCSCDDKFYGRQCQCEGINDPMQDFCKNSPVDELLCSGKGTCVCGECLCKTNPDNIYYGKYCECNDNECPILYGQLCGGSERGRCKCGTCECNENYIGAACQNLCTKNDQFCRSANNQLCSNHGTCQCGKCVCDSKYTGSLCDECKTCCMDYRPCVKCFLQIESSNLTTGCSCDYKFNFIDMEDMNGNQCVIRDENDCSIVFSYDTDSNSTIINISKEKFCPAKANVTLISVGVVLGIIGVGIAMLLIWRLLASIQDRREFAKFEDDSKNARWETADNPLFKPPTSNFKNPTYDGL